MGCDAPRGPNRISDDWGVHVAYGMVLRSLDPGRNVSHIQFETVRKMRSFYSNYAHACQGGTRSIFMSSEGTGARVSNAASNSIWFQRFMQGIHRRMGDVWVPNRAISQYELSACMDVLDLRWEAA